MRPLMLSSRQTERQSIVQNVEADDDRGNTAGLFSGVFSRVLSDFEPRLYNDLDFVGVSLHSNGQIIIWRCTAYADLECTLDEFLNWIDFSEKSCPRSPTLAVDVLRHLDRREADGFRWFAVPTILAGPDAFRFYLVGVPLHILGTMVQIKERPDVDPLFTGVLDAAIYLCGANLLKYADHRLGSPEVYDRLTPPLRLAQVVLGALVSTCEGDPPRESLGKVFDEVSRIRYEGSELIGTLFLGKKEDFVMSTQLTTVIDFSDPRLVRKVLEVHADDVAPVANCEGILGFGRPAEKAAMRCTRVRFRPNGSWLVGQAGVNADLLSVRAGSLTPLKAQPEKEFDAVFRSVFGDNACCGVASVGTL